MIREKIGESGKGAMTAGMNSAIKHLATIMCCWALVTTAASASEPTGGESPVTQVQPAVDGINAKLSFVGAVDGTETYGAVGAITFPLGHQFGLQLDGVAAEVDAGPFGDIGVLGGAAHLFWRDPSKGLIGIYSRVLHADVFGGLTTFALAAEGAVYRGRFTVEGMAGVSGGDVDTGFLSIAIAKYYPTDQLVLQAGHTFKNGDHAFITGGEWGLPAAGRATTSSVFVDGFVSETGDAGAMAGLRFYFGQSDKSLMRRHREDDPAATDVHTELHLLYNNNCIHSCRNDASDKIIQIYSRYIPTAAQ